MGHQEEQMPARNGARRRDRDPNPLRRTRRLGPLPSEEGTADNIEKTLTLKPRPESGLVCLTCAIFA